MWCNHEVRRLQEQLLRIVGPQSFPCRIFKLDDGVLTVSDSIKQLLGAVNLVLSEELSQAQTPESRLDNLCLYWDSGVLQGIMQEIRHQEEFSQKVATLFPARLGSIVKKITADEMIRRIRLRLQSLEIPAQFAKQDMVDVFLLINSNIKTNAAQMKAILGYVHSLDREEAKQICELLLISGRRFLTDARELLERGYAYDAQSLMNLTVISRNKEELHQKLGEAKTKLISLAKNGAEDCAEFLCFIRNLFPEYKETHVETFWNEIFESIRDYNESQVGPIADLERTLTAVVAGGGIGIIFTVKRPEGTYFARMYDEFTWQVKIHASARNVVRFNAMYKKFADLFNKKKLLVPFDGLKSKNNKTLSKQDLREVCQVFDSVAPTLHRILENHFVSGNLREEYGQFIKQFELCKLWLGVSKMKARVRLFSLKDDDLLWSQVQKWSLHADDKKYDSGWDAIVVPWSEHETFAIEVEIANTSEMRFGTGSSKLVLSMGGRWGWLRWMKSLHSREYSNGKVLVIPISTNMGSLLLGLSVEFLDEEDNPVEWPDLPQCAPV